MILLTRLTEERATKDKLLGTDYEVAYITLGFNLPLFRYSKVEMNKESRE
jgi:hypothetical protein